MGKWTEGDGIPVAVFTDFDGTLLTSTHTVADSSIKSYTELIKKGIPVIAATGRTVYSAQGALKDYPSMNFSFYPGVYSQGLVVYGRGGESDIVHEEHLPKNVAQAVCKFWINHPQKDDYSVIAYCGSNLYCLGPSHERFDCLSTKFKEKPPIPTTAEETAFDSQVVHKLLLIGTTELMTSLKPSVRELTEGTASMTSGVDWICEVMPLGSSKGKGVAKLCESLGIDLRLTAAIGDAANDIEMLRDVGVSYAMENGPAVAKEAADRMTGSHDSTGWAMAMSELFQQGSGKVTVDASTPTTVADEEDVSF